MSAAIHTRYSRGAIIARTKDGKGIMRLRVPYDHSLHHSQRHPAAAKALADRLGWAGLWIVGDNDDGSICAVQASGAAGRDMLAAQRQRYAEAHGIEGEDWFFVAERRGQRPKAERDVERERGRLAAKIEIPEEAEGGAAAEFTPSPMGGGWIVPLNSEALRFCVEVFGEEPESLAPLAGRAGYVVEPQDVGEMVEALRNAGCGVNL